jgi:DNA-directed RNA polymerase specialized sigma24 family protein
MARKDDGGGVDGRRALAEATARRDLDAASPLAWTVWYRPLANFLLRSGVERGELDDAMQDIFARMVAGWEGFDGSHLGGWLFALARYEALTRRTERRRELVRTERLRELSAQRPAAVDPTERHDLRETLDAVRALLDPLDALIYDALGGGLDDRETADEAERRFGTRLTPASIRCRRCRLRKRLTGLLAEGRNSGRRAE